MIIFYYLLIFLMSILGAFGFYHLLKKFPSKKELILKVVGSVLLLIMTIRYMAGDVAISSTIGLNMYSPFNDKIASTIVGTLLVWFSYASILLIALRAFFKIKNIDNLLKFLALPTLLLDFIFFKIYGIAVVGANCFEGFDLRILLLAVEIIISISYIGALFIRKDYFKITKKEVKNLLLSIVPVLLAIMPGHVIQTFFGYANTYLQTKEFSFQHRLVLYFSIIIPIIIHMCLRFKSQEIKRFSLIYLSLAVLWTFMIRYGFDMWSSPLNWPIHLCHTAMFIVPICLIFKLNKLFYFTFFINVMGAFLAMAMPNTSDTINLFSSENVLFWINHFCAFFMPVLVISLKEFKRPKMKEWIYSILAFVFYFIFILFINAWFSNYGSVDFFFLNSDFIVEKLGKWAEDTRDFVFSFKVNSKITLTFYPIYQSLFFAVYLFITLVVWFIYEQLFQIWDFNEDRVNKEREYRLIQKELEVFLKGRKKGDLQMDKKLKPCLELKNFHKKYGNNDYYSVEDVSLKVEGGQIFGFLGPNGSGKSTIIKSVVGIQTISKGSIEVCGFDVEKQSIYAKKQIGFVPDHYALYENLTGREYINYIADLYEVSLADRDRRIEKYLKDFALESSFDNQMKTYSHGMKQKITIMASLVHNPKVWILDEPLTGLDPNSIYQVKQCMKEHALKGNIVFFSSHIIDVVEKICDRIAIIKKGHLVCDAIVKDLDDKNISLEKFYLDNIKEGK